MNKDLKYYVHIYNIYIILYETSQLMVEYFGKREL